tara:strand:- start:23 stop:226 length:204 start_codon:yes stop_codon:yes gene_type:complete
MVWLSTRRRVFFKRVRSEEEEDSNSALRSFRRERFSESISDDVFLGLEEIEEEIGGEKEDSEVCWNM